MSGTNTAAPWRYAKETGMVYAADNSIVCEIGGAHEDDLPLLAAAPDLLAALIELAELAGGFNVSGVYFNECSDESNALANAWTAVAKARGEL